MNVDHLRVFKLAAELGSFTKAAVTLGLAQPSVSRIVSELEDELGGELFYRSGRGVQLSELGEETFARVGTLLSDFDRFTDEMKNNGRIPTGNVSLALPPSLIAPIVPELFNQLTAERPGIRLRILEGFGEQIAQWVAAGSVDIGIYSNYSIDQKFEDLPLKGSLLMQSASMVLASRSGRHGGEIDFRNLEGHPLVLPAIPNGLRMAVDATAKRMKLELKIVAEVDSIRSQIEMARKCGCYIIIPPDAFPVDGYELGSSLIRNPCVTRKLVLRCSQQRPLSRAARDVASRLNGIIRNILRYSP